MHIARASSAWLLLPDGKVVLQRRDSKSSASANLLATFGGGAKDGESPLEVVGRELNEETSLDVDALNFEYMFDVEWIHPKNNRKVIDSIFKVKIQSVNFKVFEGAGVESYSLDNLAKRDDLSLGMKEIIEKLQ
jgi:8-oxo-dGTP pyrophosphatase MutT (NUDIX family)